MAARLRAVIGRLSTVALLAAIGGFPSAAAAQDPIEVGTESELRQAWEDPHARAIELTDDIFLRACRSGDPIRESPVPMTARRQRAHAAPDLLREAAAAPGRHRLSAAQEHHPDPRRQRRPRRRRDHAGRDRRSRTPRSSRTSPRSRAAASSPMRRVDDHPLGHHRQPRQRRRRRRLRAPRRRPGLRLDHQQQPRRRFRRRARLDRRHPRRPLARRRQHHRRRRRRDLRRRGRRRHRDRLDRQRQHGRRPGRRDLHSRRRRHDRQLDPQRQPRRRSRRGDLGRGRRDGHRTRRSPATPRSRTSAAGSGRAATRSSPTRRSADNYAEGRAAACSAAGDLGLVNSTVTDNVASRPAQTSVPASASRPSARSSARRTRNPSAATIQPTSRYLPRSRAPESFGYNFVTDTSCFGDAHEPDRRRSASPIQMLGATWRRTAASARPWCPDPGSPVWTGSRAGACEFVPFG